MSATTSNIKLRILVVDDEPDILLGLNAVLRAQSHTVKTFDNPSQALKHLTASEVTPYDLVITDYRMPGGLSGLDLAKRVKEYTRRKTKVFLMTGFDVSSLREFSEALTSEIADEIIQKPIPNEKLIAIIEKSFLHHNH
ncbi:MAG: response regulator [Thermoproteota archaeon]|jgi:DNA-binding NtrC family response regulator|nr:response regulator [Thermoproteota archaeon]